MANRVGLGYDIHRFKKGRKLILGGVEIPYGKGLDGHSDADVLLHALCDALLGAAGEGDIGEHFPNTDPAFKGANSVNLLETVINLVQSKGYWVVNADMVIQAEEPKIKPYKLKMRELIAGKLDVKIDAVNIKATTQEKLGDIGQGLGIAAFATVLLEKKGK